MKSIARSNGSRARRWSTTPRPRSKSTSIVSAGEPSRPAGLRSRGQALIIIAFMLMVLVLFVGLGLDVGNLMGRRAKLQSAVDASALSATQLLLNNTNAQTLARQKAFQIMEANGVLSPTLNMSSTVVTFPAPQQVRVRATQRVDTFFMSILPIWAQVEISAEATADINSYAEIDIKPYGKPGVVTALNLMVWGNLSRRSSGDNYSAQYKNDGTSNSDEYNKQPYGYLYRIDVPPGYSNRYLYLEMWDPDSYNKPNPPPTPWGAPSCSPSPCVPTPTPTLTVDMYAYCATYNRDLCSTGTTGGGNNYDPGIKINGYPNGRPAFWRVDEYRQPYNLGGNAEYNQAYATKSQYTLWHFNPRITSAFADPSILSDQPGNSYIARFTIGPSTTMDNSGPDTSAPNTYTDLMWYRPSNFTIELKDALGNDRYEREANGSMYFYLYVQGIEGSSENNFDLRVGPPQGSYNCSTPCYINRQYHDGVADWTDGGARIFAKRSLPLNLDTGSYFPMRFTQVSKNAAGQTLGIRHFDQDCNNGCGTVMRYQMQKCGATDLEDPASWAYIQNPNGSNAQGYVGGNDVWVSTAGSPPTGGWPDPELVTIPTENSIFFKNGATVCDTSWLRIELYPSYSNDTTIWELPFIRPRLIR